ncbi:MAG: AAA family ATPase, partial [Halobacteriaceae archaeon]
MDRKHTSSSGHSNSEADFRTDGGGKLFTPDNNIYKNRDAVKDSYSPKQIVGRDDKIADYRKALQPVVNGEEPDNILVYGKTGVGKTVVTKYILNVLVESAEEYDIDLTVLNLNCKDSNTSYQTTIRLVNDLRDQEDQMSQAGHAEWKVYQALWDELDDLGGTVLVVLDEIDNIRDDDIIYQLSRAQSEGKLENAKIGVIGISNDLTYRDKLQKESQSTFAQKSVFFPPYDSSQLVQLLKRRKEIAFQEDSINESELRLIAAYGAKDSGDARKSLRLLREAGDIARNERVESVTKEHVEQAKELIETEEIITGIKENLSDNEKLALYALTTLEAEDETPAKTSRVYERYSKIAKLRGTDPVTSRRLRDFLSEL